MDSQSGFRLTPQLVLGLLALAAGVLFLLDNLNVLSAFDYLRFWPLGIIALGLAIVFETGKAPGHLAGMLLIAFGSILLLSNLHVIHFRFRDFLPIILVIIGGSLVYQVFARERISSPQSVSSVSAISILGGVTKAPNTKDFRGGELTAIMGGCEIDLRSADMQADEAVINVFAFWGGIEIKVPENWSVVSQVIPLLGGCEDRSQAPKDISPKRLMIKGFVIMGGIEVRN